MCLGSSAEGNILSDTWLRIRRRNFSLWADNQIESSHAPASSWQRLCSRSTYPYKYKAGEGTAGQWFLPSRSNTVRNTFLKGCWDVRAVGDDDEKGVSKCMPARVTTMGCNISRAFSRRRPKVVRKRSGNEGGVAEDAGLGPGSARNGISHTESCH